MGGMGNGLPRLAAIAALVALGAACRSEPIPPPPAAPEENAPKRRGGTLVMALGEDIQTLDPTRTIDLVSLFAVQLVSDTLLDYPREGTIARSTLVPSLASTWSTSEDGRTLTFEIREKARFSNGEPVLAEDFVFAIERLLSPESASPYAQFFTVVEGARERMEGKTQQVRGFEAKAERTLVIRLEHADPSFPLLLAMPQTTPQKRSHAAREGKNLMERPLGTGPFAVGEYRPGQELALVRNPFYWDEPRPWLDGVRLRLGVPRDVMLLGFLRGDIDLLDGRICEDALLVAREDAWAPYVQRTPLPIVVVDVMNNRRPPFDDKRVRQAFNLAIDKNDSVRLSNGRVMAANGFLPPSVPGHDPSRRPWPHDPARAKALLAEAGHADGFEVTYTTLRDEMAQKIALSIQADLAEVGVRLNIETLTFPAYMSSIGRGEYAFAFSGWSMDFPDPWDFLEVKFHSRMIEAGTNDSGYRNAEVDKLLDAARLEGNDSTRLALYRHAEDILFEDCPNVWHYFGMSVDVRRPRIRGPIRHPVRDLSFRDTFIVDDAL
jgi:oligopeptide transport system substrate-binding protein